MAGIPSQMDLFGGGSVVPDSGVPPPAADRSSGVGPRAATAGEFLAALQQRGATRLQQVRFRRNRRVLWSLTDRGRTLNLHEAYAGAPPSLLDAFALLAGNSRDAEGRRRSARRVREWPPVVEAMGRLREVEVLAALAVARGRRGEEGEAPPETPGVGPSCVGGEEERTRILSLYRRFNRERFDGCLPPEVPIRLSNRMRRRLGHMRPGTGPGGDRVVVEIALNHQLLLAANHHLLLDTLLHEMAHAADWLVDGRAGHGPSWRGWARRVGCQPRACTTTRLEGPVKGGAGGKNRRRPRG